MKLQPSSTRSTRVAVRAVHCVVWLALCAPGAARPAEGPGQDLSTRYAAMAPIERVPQEGLQRLRLPLPVLQASRSTAWADVRVLDAAGQPVPTAWLPPATAVNAPAPADVLSAPLPRFAWPSPPTGGSAATADAADLRVVISRNGAVVNIASTPPQPAPGAPAAAAPTTLWLLDLSALPRPGRAIERLQLDWPAQAQGVDNRVEVEGSDDAQRWSPIAAGPLLELPALPPEAAGAGPSAATAAATAAPSVKHVDWPAGRPMPRYLRLRLEQPLALSSAHLRWQATPAPTPLSTATVQFLPVAAEGQQPAHWALDLQGAVPLQRLQLELPQINTVWGLRLERRNDPREAWQPAAAFVAWRLQRDGREQQSAPIEWRTTPANGWATTTAAARHWRLVPDTRTAARPAQPLTATVGWQSPQLLLVAQGTGALRLAVGKPGDADASVAWHTLVPGADEAALNRLPEAGLGPLAPQAVADTTVGDRLKQATPEDQRRWLLWGVLALAVLGLGGLAWRLAQDMRQGRNRPHSAS